ncbi:MAG: fatty acid oxidation complex subunit alpha FadJ, partial [Acidobacteria bacterium]|nr:fatty acid oxidation complex subunit alpha FadJ [Acidobacteriota bacterium]
MSHSQSGLDLEKRDDGIAVVTIDLPDRPVNVIRNDFFPAVESIIGAVESDPLIKAVILRSGKDDSFVAGADLGLVSSFESP